jgi:endonuclease IV
MRKDLLAFNIEAVKPIVAMAASHGLKVVFENYKTPFDRASTFKTLLAAVPCLKLHLDFGHTNFGLDNHEFFCRELGEHVQHVHFSDNRSRSDDHMPLGVGTVDWKKAVNVLTPINGKQVGILYNTPQGGTELSTPQGGIKNKKMKSIAKTNNLNIPPRHLHPSRGY